jgi:YggT family protein
LSLLCTLGSLYLLVLFARIILSWFPISPGGAMAGIVSFLYGVTEPVLGPLRRALPPVGIGGMGLDLSPLIVIIGLQIILSVLGCRGGLF